MENSKYTEGDWIQVWNENNFPSTCIIKSIQKDGSQKSICSINTNDEDNSNAKLIVEAPKLLEALIEVRKHMTAHIPEKVFDLIDNVINKATK